MKRFNFYVSLELDGVCLEKKGFLHLAPAQKCYDDTLSTLAENYDLMPWYSELDFSKNVRFRHKSSKYNGILMLLDMKR